MSREHLPSLPSTSHKSATPLLSPPLFPSFLFFFNKEAAFSSQSSFYEGWGLTELAWWCKVSVKWTLHCRAVPINRKQFLRFSK